MNEEKLKFLFGTKLLWVQICRWLWHALQWLWTFIFVGAAINILTIWLISKPRQFELTGTPMGWLLEHLYVTFTLIVILIMITVIVGLVATLSDPPPLPPPLVPWEENRDGFLKQLHYDYNELLEQFLPN